MRRTFAVFALALLVAADVLAQPTIFMVRHAERADAVGAAPPMMAADPPLSDAGRARAASLAAILKDAGITAIFVTEYKRTQETAAPLAKSLGVTVTTVPAKDTAALIDRLKSAKGNVLVVGHSNTLPDVLTGLGVKTPIAIADSEYDNLLVIATGAESRLVRLHYR